MAATLDWLWTIRSAGFGHRANVREDILSMVRLAGHDFVISIQHGDALLSSDEGMLKAVIWLKEAVVFEDGGGKF